MTHIPGTGSTKKQPKVETPTPVATKEGAPFAMSVTNVDSVKKATTVVAGAVIPRTVEEEPEIWHQRLIGWMGFGAIAGVVCSLIGLRYHSFFALAPLGPTIGAVAWYVRKFVKKYTKGFDMFIGR